MGRKMLPAVAANNKNKKHFAQTLTTTTSSTIGTNITIQWPI